MGKLDAALDQMFSIMCVMYQCFLQTFKQNAENFAGVKGAAKPPAGLRDSVPVGVREAP